MTKFISRLYRIPRLIAGAWENATVTIPTAEELQIQDEAIALRVLKKHARGNISLKKGRILTTEFLAKRKKFAMECDFS